MATKVQEWGGWRGLALYSLLTSVVSGAVVGAFLKWSLDKDFEQWRSARTWQTSALAEIVAPSVMHLARTAALAERYREQPRYGEAVLLRDSNAAMRSLILGKAHLLPTELVPVSECLLTHYDIWLKRFDLSLDGHRRAHGGAEPQPDAAFDVGFAALEATRCGSFPREAPPLFRKHFDLLRKALYDQPATGG